MIVGGGHNGLVAAALLARAGRSVVVLECREHVGGAAVSGSPWPGVDARLSRYSYLVSLFPAALRAELGLRIELRARAVASYPPAGNAFDGLRVRIAERLGPTLLEPLRGRDEIAALLDEDAWLLEQPLSEQLEQCFGDDVARGIELTDGTIGTFASADDPLLRQNRCYLYHVVGGPWNIPVGGMGALTSELERLARGAGAEIVCGAEVDDDRQRRSRGPAHVRRRLTAPDRARAGERRADAAGGAARRASAADGERPEGSQLKLNMLVARLPALRDAGADPGHAFAGTFHVNEGYAQLRPPTRRRRAGGSPRCRRASCTATRSPTRRSSPRASRRRRPHADRVRAAHAGAAVRRRRSRAREAGGRGGDAAIARLGAGRADLRAACGPTPTANLASRRERRPSSSQSWECRAATSSTATSSGRLPSPSDEIGRWGVETELPNIWLCGAGARRGGGVSGIPGHNAARAVLGS